MPHAKIRGYIDGNGGTKFIPSPHLIVMSNTAAENSSLYTRNTEASIPFVNASLPRTCHTDVAVTARSIRKYTIDIFEQLRKIFKHTIKIHST